MPSCRRTTSDGHYDSYSVGSDYNFDFEGLTNIAICYIMQAVDGCRVVPFIRVAAPWLMAEVLLLFFFTTFGTFTTFTTFGTFESLKFANAQDRAQWTY